MQAQALGKELEREVDAVSIFVKSILEKNSLSLEKFIEILKEKENGKKISVPCCIFRERSLGILEALTIYLKDNLNLSYSEIASLINRGHSPVWMSYHNARKKFKGKLVLDKNGLLIPVSIFSERKLGLLENLTKYLKEDVGLNNYEIALALNRDKSTIWTSYNRISSKLGADK